MRRIAALGLGLWLALGAGAAAAAPFTGGTVTLDAPEGWSTSYEAEIRQILLESPDKKCRVAVQMADAEGLTDQQLAGMLSKELKGTTPQKLPGYDNYCFDARMNGMDMTISLFELKGVAFVYIEGGDSWDRQEETARIWNSLSSTDEAEQALFNAMEKAR